MKPQIATTIEESHRLLACGVDPKTADMHWCKFLNAEPFLALGEIPRDNETGDIINDGDVPAWSLSALIELLDTDLYASLTKFNGYYKIDSFKVEIDAETPIEACVQMIEWLTANGYSLNKTAK